MTTLVVGASGATGRLLVDQLLKRGEAVVVIVRVGSALPATIANHENLSIVQASLLELNDAEIAQHVRGCDAIASCLGHNLTFRGLFGQPRQLVTVATQRLCNAAKVNQPAAPVKFVLMNTAGNSNRDLSESVSLAQKCIIWLIRLLLPPHADNERAADYLRTEIGQRDPAVEWVAVRPDSLTNAETVSDYETYASPLRSAIFDPGTTSRINVAHFMTALIKNESIWTQWKGKMPVIYNRDQLSPTPKVMRADRGES